MVGFEPIHDMLRAKVFGQDKELRIPLLIEKQIVNKIKHKIERVDAVLNDHEKFDSITMIVAGAISLTMKYG